MLQFFLYKENLEIYFFTNNICFAAERLACNGFNKLYPKMAMEFFFSLYILLRRRLDQMGKRMMSMRQATRATAKHAHFLELF